MRASKRERSVLGTDERFCRVCETVTTHDIEVSRPARRRFARGAGDVLDLVERHWAHCSRCGYRFAEAVEPD